ncbi:hypothetical protein [Aureimonas sp. Leaf324]|uniref:hypothetical protein n=1 Tax=Aureimonas sp. Leaf324 TaxID=1736336 RepID=UPI0012E13F9E|nr:hypothetical protein [Aureimonas sp. Leaf324]
MPGDIGEIAFNLADNFVRQNGLDLKMSQVLADRIAQALVQEREGCAFAAECHSGFGDEHTIDACAAIIRSRGSPGMASDSIHVSHGRYLELLVCEEMAAKLPPEPPSAEAEKF